ncbi:MAG: hypothetical protein AB1502_19410, partial [Thermodesulfobacteriota bacterium]
GFQKMISQIFLYYQCISNLCNRYLIPACGRQGCNQRFLDFFRNLFGDRDKSHANITSKVNPSTPRPEARGLPSAQDFGELSRAAQAKGSACLPCLPQAGAGRG